MNPQQLRIYGELAVKVGLNLQPGQRLLIIGPLANGGASLEAAPLVGRSRLRAYRAGAPLVEACWGDEALQLARFKHAPRDSFGEFSAWLPGALVEHVEAGHAVLSVYANDPDLLKNEPTELVGAVQQRHVARCAAVSGAHFAQPDELGGDRGRQRRDGPRKSFPSSLPTSRCPGLWDAIGRLCRLDRADPLAAWETHLEALAARRRLPERASGTARLKYRGRARI